MRIFEPHIHMYARTTDDYERMAKAGIEVIVEPAFWLGEPRKYAGTFFDYFDHLINFEHTRAARYGIKQYVTIAMNPKEANNYELAEDVLEELPRFLDRENVVGVGEIGFDQITPAEEDFFIRQLELASQFKLPVLIHSPHLNKLEGIKKNIEILKNMDYDISKVLIDHNTEETTAISRESGAWCGHSVYSITKLTPERAANIVEKYGVERMMVNSAADWGASDPLSVPHTVDELLTRNFPEKEIEKLVWDNPYNFFSQSGRMR
ncbi:MAG: hypothetical protein A2W23_08810 [Planctomycetes bacterium RBG_16_43_13]|nr:MAG: hypothetical protein A2W23_08810 [Planctomycetes bacterium RBG_16_43_13]